MFKEEETQYCPMCEEWAEKYDQLKAENEELKITISNNEKWFSEIDIKNSEYWKEIYADLHIRNGNRIEELKKECDELKTEFDKFEEQIKLQGNFIDSFLFTTKNSEWRNKSILEDEADAIIEKVESDYVQLENYKQALQEIKEIAENGCIGGYGCSELDQILQKMRGNR